MKEDFSGDISLVSEDLESGQLTNPKQIDTGIKPPDEQDSLEEIINRVNQRFPDEFSEKDRVLIEGLYKSFMIEPDARLVNMAKNNDAQIFEKSLFPEVFQEKLMDEYTNNEKAYEKLMGADDKYYKLVYTLLAKDIYKQLRGVG